MQQITTVLLDLDDTLLDSNMRQFIPAYVDLLAEALAQFAPPETIKQQLYETTARLQADHKPGVTNYQAFFKAFLPHLAGTTKDILAAIDHFYRERYPSLQRFTSPRPAASQVVKHLIQAGCQVVIATNPLFPRTAIEQRMAWAGVLDFSFALVTHQENMHTSKPSPDYYQEILARLQLTPAECLMVGDDPKNDIEPAQSLGIKTWWITDLVGSTSDISPDHQGSLAQFLSRIEHHGLDFDSP